MTGTLHIQSRYARTVEVLEHDRKAITYNAMIRRLENTMN